MSETGTATLVRRLGGYRGDARLYRVEPPMECYDGPATHVIVSAVVAMYSGPETYIFPCNGDSDEPRSWAEQEGSFQGGLDHVAALRGAGYEVTQ